MFVRAHKSMLVVDRYKDSNRQVFKIFQTEAFNIERLKALKMIDEAIRNFGQQERLGLKLQMFRRLPFIGLPMDASLSFKF